MKFPHFFVLDAFFNWRRVKKLKWFSIVKRVESSTVRILFNPLLLSEEVSSSLDNRSMCLCIRRYKSEWEGVGIIIWIDNTIAPKQFTSFYSPNWVCWVVLIFKCIYCCNKKIELCGSSEIYVFTYYN